MINKRLVNTVSESKKYIAGNVVCQWISLISNIIMMASITSLLAKMFYKNATNKDLIFTFLTSILTVIARFICTTMSGKMSYGRIS